MKIKTDLRISIDNQTILKDIIAHDITWHVAMDLIHLSICSKFDISKSLHQYIEHDVTTTIQVKKSLLWILSAYADDVINQLPELPEDMCWETIREYDLEVQTWLIAKPITIDWDIAHVTMSRFNRFLKVEESEGYHIPLELYKCVESYTSTLQVYNDTPRRVQNDRNNQHVRYSRS